MKIANIEFPDNPVFLAPMEDVTDIGFRLLCKRFGADMVYTEFVSSDALIRDVKKTLPYAKQIAGIITETYEYMETLPDDKARQKHLNQMEKYLMDEYTPKMKKLTKSQGQLLMKLVDRETNSSSYYIIDAFMGSFKAWTYNVFAGLFGNSLKIRYNPYGDDRVTERVCVLVEQGGV